MKIKTTLILTALLLSALMLFTACSVKTTGGASGTTEGGTTEGGTTANTDTTTTGDVGGVTYPDAPIMDLVSANLDQYITLGDYKTLKFEQNVYADDATLEAELTAFAAEKGYYSLITDRVTKKGDYLEIAFAGTKDGVAFEGGTSDKATISLSDVTGYIDGFDKDLYGIMPGTTVNSDVTFPENYGVDDLNGQTVQFAITVKGIITPLFTDDQIKELSEDKCTTYAELREYYRNMLTVNNLTNYENNLISKIVEAINGISTVVLIPEQHFNYYYYDMMNYYKSSYEANAESYKLYYGVNSFEDFLAKNGLTTAVVEDSAKLYVIEDLILVSCAKKEGLTITDDEYSIGMQRVAEENGQANADQLIAEYGETFWKMYLLKEKCVDHLIDTLDITTDYDTYAHLLDEEEAENTTTAN